LALRATPDPWRVGSSLWTPRRSISMCSRIWSASTPTSPPWWSRSWRRRP